MGGVRSDLKNRSPADTRPATPSINPSITPPYQASYNSYNYHAPLPRLGFPGESITRPRPCCWEETAARPPPVAGLGAAAGTRKAEAVFVYVGGLRGASTSGGTGIDMTPQHHRSIDRSTDHRVRPRSHRPLSHDRHAPLRSRVATSSSRSRLAARGVDGGLILLAACWFMATATPPVGLGSIVGIVREIDGFDRSSKPGRSARAYTADRSSGKRLVGWHRTAR